MSRNRIKYELMRSEGNAIDVLMAKNHAALVGEPFDDRFMKRGVDRIARNQRDNKMELDVAAHELGRVSKSRLVEVERLLQLAKIVLGRDPRRLFGESALKERPGALKVPGAIRLGQQEPR